MLLLYRGMQGAAHIPPAVAGLVVGDGQIPHLGLWEAHDVRDYMLIQVGDACV